MPSVVFDVQNSFATITRFVVKSTMEQLMHITGIDKAEIIYNEPLGYGKNPAANSNPDAPALKLDSKDYLIVTYNERFDEQTIDPLAHQEEHNPIFLNRKLGLRLRPITSKANIEFSLTYRSKSYNRLAVWLSRFQRNKVVREPHNYHDLMYNYNIPDPVVAYIYDVYHLSEQVGGYGITLKEFYQTHYTEGLISRSNLSKSKNALAVNVVSKGNLGYFTQLPDEVDTDKDKTVHEITFSYTLSYDKVTELLFEYQWFIHNQRVDNIYKQFFVHENHPVEKHQGNRTFSGFVNTVTERRDWYHVSEESVFLDPLDNWLPARPLGLTSTMLVTPLQVDINDDTLVLDINDIPAENLPPLVKTVLLEFNTLINTAYALPFMVQLYAVDDVEKPIILTMDANGIIRSDSPLDVRKRHYLRISQLLDLRRLPYSTIRALCRNPEMLMNIILMINPKANVEGLRILGKHGVFGDLLNPLAGMIDIESLWRLLNEPIFLNNGKIRVGNMAGGSFGIQRENTPTVSMRRPPGSGNYFGYDPIGQGDVSSFFGNASGPSTAMGFNANSLGYYTSSYVQTTNIIFKRG